MKRLSIIVGAGGTGSYLLPNLLAYYKGLPSRMNDENHIYLMDGDVVEDKNLLRQGFLNEALNHSKSEALVEMYKNGYPDFNLEYVDKFLNYSDELVSVVKQKIEDLDEVFLFSCVDNNFARLRILVAQQLIKQEFPSLLVTFIDSGNEEWHGQSIVSHMPRGAEAILEMVNGKLSLCSENYTHSVDNIFVRMQDWENHLDRGEHELSCDVVSVSHPQNIGTNMNAASVMIMVLDDVLQDREDRETQNIQFNAHKNTINRYDISPKVDYLRVMNEIAEFANTNEGVLSKLFVTMKMKKEAPKVKEDIVNAFFESPFTVKEESDSSLKASKQASAPTMDKEPVYVSDMDVLNSIISVIDVEDTLEENKTSSDLETVAIDLDIEEREDLLKKSLDETLEAIFDF